MLSICPKCGVDASASVSFEREGVVKYTICPIH